MRRTVHNMDTGTKVVHNTPPTKKTAAVSKPIQPFTVWRHAKHVETSVLRLHHSVVVKVEKGKVHFIPMDHLGIRMLSYDAAEFDKLYALVPEYPVKKAANLLKELITEYNAEATEEAKKWIEKIVSDPKFDYNEADLAKLPKTPIRSTVKEVKMPEAATAAPAKKNAAPMKVPAKKVAAKQPAPAKKTPATKVAAKAPSKQAAATKPTGRGRKYPDDARVKVTSTEGKNAFARIAQLAKDKKIGTVGALIKEAAKAEGIDNEKAYYNIVRCVQYGMLELG